MSAPTGALAVLRRRRRVIEDGGNRPHPAEPAPAWVTGVLAAAQAAVLSLALLVLPSVAAYVATSADPSNVSTSWPSAVQVGANLWLLGHGTPLAVGEGLVTLVPLGLSFLLIFLCYASARRTIRTSRWALGAGIGSYVVLALFVALTAGARSGGQLTLTLLGAAVVAGLGLGGGALTNSGAPRIRELLDLITSRISPTVRLGVRGGLLAASLLVGVSALLIIVWVFMGRSESMDVIDALSLGVLDGVILALAQALFVVNLIAWGLAWLAGPGFAVGSGSVFAPTEVVMGPLPAVPLLGALPDEGLVNSVTMFAPAVVALIGVFAGAFVWRRTSGGMTWAQIAISVPALGGAAGLVGGLLIAISSGGIGPERMSEVGAQVLPVTGFIALEVGVGALVTMIAAHGATHRFLRSLVNWRTWRGWIHRLTGTPGAGGGAETAIVSSARTAQTGPTPPSAPGITPEEGKTPPPPARPVPRPVPQPIPPPDDPAG